MLGGGQRSILGVSLNCTPSYFWKQDLSLNLKLASPARLTGHQVPEIFLSICLLSARIIYMQLYLESSGARVCMVATG